MITKNTYKDSELTGKIIGCAMEVHRYLDNGFQEVVYQRALSIELNLNNISHEREKELPLKYKGYDIGTRRVGFFVENKSSKTTRRCASGTSNKLSGILWNGNRLADKFRKHITTIQTSDEAKKKKSKPVKKSKKS